MTHMIDSMTPCPEENCQGMLLSAACECGCGAVYYYCDQCDYETNPHEEAQS